jgi:hypothetical protein
MGQQQLLLIILGVIIVGIAIAVGLQLFQSGSVGANQDAIINDIMNVAAHAQQYMIRPTSMGGGGGSFTGYVLPNRLESTGNGNYTVTSANDDGITIRGESIIHTGGWVQLVFQRATADGRDVYTWSSDGTVFDIEGSGEVGEPA